MFHLSDDCFDKWNATLFLGHGHIPIIRFWILTPFCNLKLCFAILNLNSSRVLQIKKEHQNYDINSLWSVWKTYRILFLTTFCNHKLFFAMFLRILKGGDCRPFWKVIDIIACTSSNRSGIDAIDKPELWTSFRYILQSRNLWKIFTNDIWT